MYLFNLLKKSLLLLVLTLNLFAEGDYVDADLGVSLDYSRFSIEGGVYLDVYLLIPKTAFTYEIAGTEFEAQVVFQVALLQGDIVPYPPDRWQRTYRARNQAEVTSLGFIPDISKFYVEAGDYSLQVDILDVNSNRRQRIRKPISLNLFPDEELTISDLTIASQIVKTETESVFTKYGHDVVPNAERVFTVENPLLYYYFEAYGLIDTGSYQVHPEVLSIAGDVVKDLYIQTKKSRGKSAVEWGGVNTSDLSSGIYKLSLTFSDMSNNAQVNQKKTFYVVRPKEIVEEEPTFDSDSYMSMNESQLDEDYQLVSLIMTKKEQKMYKRSKLEAKRRILTSVWMRHDPDPDTPANEFKIEFYKRIQLANREYNSEATEGWKTDRGRVLIQYGQPSTVSRNTTGMGEKPWESWHYFDIQGGIIFVFVDRNGYGDFQLVHSTARDEIQDDSWRRLLN
ncbi:MAG: GWxTD domain-containing protein [Candidatus Marinimicrobia bacterium]|nr:GWxTD domain-containing protein [Candidatus Neomarinimicrobiota bacterium]